MESADALYPVFVLAGMILQRVLQWVTWRVRFQRALTLKTERENHIEPPENDDATPKLF